MPQQTSKEGILPPNTRTAPADPHEDDAEMIRRELRELSALIELSEMLEQRLDAYELDRKEVATRSNVRGFRDSWAVALADKHRYRVRAMFIVAGVSVVERAVRNIVEYAREEAKVSATVSEAPGMKLNKMQTYSIQQLKVPPRVFGQDHWKNLKAWWQVRNEIVHAEGRIWKPLHVQACRRLQLHLRPIIPDPEEPEYELVLGNAHLVNLRLDAEHFLVAMSVALRNNGYPPIDFFTRAMRNFG